MLILELLIVAIMVVVSVFGTYYQLQIISNLKSGMGKSAFTGGWVFHPEYLEKEGQSYRKKLLICWAIFISLALVVMVLVTL